MKKKKKKKYFNEISFVFRGSYIFFFSGSFELLGLQVFLFLSVCFSIIHNNRIDFKNTGEEKAFYSKEKQNPLKSYFFLFKLLK